MYEEEVRSWTGDERKWKEPNTLRHWDFIEIGWWGLLDNDASNGDSGVFIGTFFLGLGFLWKKDLYQDWDISSQFRNMCRKCQVTLIAIVQTIDCNRESTYFRWWNWIWMIGISPRGIHNIILDPWIMKIIQWWETHDPNFSSFNSKWSIARYPRI